MTIRRIFTVAILFLACLLFRGGIISIMEMKESFSDPEGGAAGFAVGSLLPGTLLLIIGLALLSKPKAKKIAKDKVATED
jgi:hypothetical protein